MCTTEASPAHRQQSGLHAIPLVQIFPICIACAGSDNVRKPDHIGGTARITSWLSGYSL